MTTISIRFENRFLNDINKAMKSNRYSTKAEFIREAVRDKIDELEKKEALKRLEKSYGAGVSKHKTTHSKLRKAKELAFKDLEEKFKQGLRVV
tara:strand:- start:17 stop:295 length:279 start_codon:yes stop_codon:yes gene_type:complete